MLLDNIDGPADLRRLDYPALDQLADEIRTVVVDAATRAKGHLGSNLGAVELTLAFHRVFDSPNDIILWDTGHQAYVHKIVTGRQTGFERLRQAGGLSGYPSREESPHDFIENSHASTSLSYASGLATAFERRSDTRRVVAVIGDGALTGGMAWEALNNITAEQWMDYAGLPRILRETWIDFLIIGALNEKPELASARAFRPRRH